MNNTDILNIRSLNQLAIVAVNQDIFHTESSYGRDDIIVDISRSLYKAFDTDNEDISDNPEQFSRLVKRCVIADQESSPNMADLILEMVKMRDKINTAPLFLIARAYYHVLMLARLTESDLESMTLESESAIIHILPGRCNRVILDISRMLSFPLPIAYRGLILRHVLELIEAITDKTVTNDIIELPTLIKSLVVYRRLVFKYKPNIPVKSKEVEP